MLRSAGDKKIQVIKVVRGATEPGPEGSQGPGGEAPKPLMEGVSKEEGEKWKKELEEAGATVEIK